MVRKLFLSVFCCGAVGCSGLLSSGPVTPLYETRQAVATYLTTQYDSDFNEVVSDARDYLRERVEESKGKNEKLAVVLDIDETALSNWQPYRLNELARIVEGPCDLEKGPCGIRAWQAMAKAPPLKPTLQLVKDAKKFGADVFFISGRPAELQEPTERNLREAGYVFDRVIVYPPDRDPKKFMSQIQFKAPQRKALTEQGYSIALCIGDQESDIQGGYCERGFKLPNPVYYLP